LLRNHAQFCQDTKKMKKAAKRKYTRRNTNSEPKEAVGTPGVSFETQAQINTMLELQDELDRYLKDIQKVIHKFVDERGIHKNSIAFCGGYGMVIPDAERPTEYTRVMSSLNVGETFNQRGVIANIQRRMDEQDQRRYSRLPVRQSRQAGRPASPRARRPQELTVCPRRGSHGLGSGD
jgi:ribosomal protein S20